MTDTHGLTDHKSRFEALISSIPDIIMEVDTAKVYTWANQSGFDFFGPDVIGKSAGYYFVGEQETFLKVEPVFMGNDQTIYVESWQRRRDGDKRLLAWWCRTLRDASGCVTGSISTARDITEERASEQRLRAIMDASADAIVMLDRSGIVIDSNELHAGRIGLTRQELIGKCVFDFFPAALAEARRTYVERVFLSSQPFKGSDVRNDTHNEFVIYPVFGEGRMVRYVAVYSRDISAEQASALAGRKTEELVSFLATLTGSGHEGDFFHALAKYLAKCLDADYVCVDLLEGDGLNARTLAVWFNGKFEDNVVYALKDTPCGKVVGNPVCCFPSGVARLFPSDTILQEMGAEGYVGVTLWDHNGTPIGLIAVISTRPIENRKLAEDLLKIVSVRAAGELERQNAEALMRESEEKWRKLVATIPDYIALHDAEGKYLFLNHYAEGFTETDIVGKILFDFLPERSKSIYSVAFEACMQEGKSKHFEYEAYGNNGEIRTYEGFLVPMNTGGGMQYVLSVARDITNIKHANELIVNALKEKEVLLREVNHRVKNNLQVISSLLNLKAHKIVDESMKEILWESRNRIRSIALVHEKLYQSGDFTGINMRDYTKTIMNELCRAYLGDTDKIQIHLDVDQIILPLSCTIPCGLILNEIISNSLKYAFPEERTATKTPQITLTIRQLPDNRIRISAGDNGIGFTGNPDMSDSTSLGLYLINILATDQLNGELEICHNDGTLYTITFNPATK